ncbi:MAG: hypothetical protein CMM90_08585 [Rickettsiales bacterium]|nr:hypothetical protein [Rickettsiales bacterium]|tara:strand:- start:800 stop:1630 length:831 start_codon:yes stop_codon:yes gene_type:complete
MFFFYLFKILGVRISSFLGGSILLCYGLFSRRNNIVKKNLKRVFPQITEKKQNQIINEMWFHFGRVIGEYPNLNRLEIGENKNISVSNEENLIKPLQNNKNCLFFSAHIGNWELTSHLLTKRGFKIHFIYRAPNNKYVDNLLRQIRNDYGVDLIKKGNRGARECLTVLNKKGGHIGMLIDQKMNDGINSKFFNEVVKSPSAIAKFALRFKCPIIPAVCLRTNSTFFNVSYLKPISPKKIKQLGNEKRIMNYLNKYVEDWVRKNPEQWIWFHNRWNN